MFKKIILLICGVSMIGFAGCTIETPEIRGVVLDAETRRPVPEAWIRGTLDIRTKTLQGEVDTYLAIEAPHTRSNEKGEFVIPATEFKKTLPPDGFGTEVLNFTVAAETIDDRVGFYALTDLEWGKRVNLIINIRPSKENEGQYFLYLQSLFDYCLLGRRGVRVPVVKGGADDWELNYTIVKHERFLKRLGEPETSDQRNHYSIIGKQLAYLYKKKGKYKKALDLFMSLHEFDRKRNMDLWLGEYEVQIKEIQKLLGEKGK